MTLIVFNVSVSVKIAEYPYSSKHYTLPSNTLSREMFQYLYMKIQQDFQLEPENYYITLRDLIGQAPCVVVENTSIRNQFHLKHRFNRNIAFYIIKNHRENEDAEEQEQPQEQEQIETLTQIECPICYCDNTHSNPVFTTVYQCCHPICRQCHILCIQYNRRICSLCRSAETRIR